MDFPVLTLGLGSRKSPLTGSSRVMQLERLEERITPDGGKYISPKLTFTVLNVLDNQATVQGRVTGTYNAGATVSFAGAASGSATADSAGYFTFYGSASALGTLSGVAVDNHGTQTSTVNGMIHTRQDASHAIAKRPTRKTRSTPNRCCMIAAK